MKLKMWPRKAEAVTAAQLLQVAREHRAAYAKQLAEEERVYREKMAEWRSTIADRLLAEIPKLAGEDINEDGSYNGSNIGYPFEAPSKPWRRYLEDFDLAIEVLEAMDSEHLVSAEMREAIARLGGVHMSYD